VSKTDNILLFFLHINYLSDVIVGRAGFLKRILKEPSPKEKIQTPFSSVIRRKGSENGMELRMIPISEIQPNPFQPRENFERESLKELADSIKDGSIINPITVRRHEKGYQIIAGERRWRAAQMAGLKEIPSIIKDIPQESVLLTSIVENLHRSDLSDIERENAIFELWKSGLFKARDELAKAIGVPKERVLYDIEAKEFRGKEKVPMDTSTRTIRGTRGLPTRERKAIIEKVQKGEFKVSEVDTVAKVLRRAHEVVKKELLNPKSRMTPRMAETLVIKLPTKEEQEIVVDEIKRFRLTEDEVEDRVRDIQRAKEMGRPLGKEMGVKEGIIYTVGEYECPHCKRHYLIKCDGKKDWVE
jgi:ParB family chromosome partitioning protein